jgi:hypothetical protein
MTRIDQILRSVLSTLPCYVEAEDSNQEEVERRHSSDAPQVLRALGTEPPDEGVSSVSGEALFSGPREEPLCLAVCHSRSDLERLSMHCCRDLVCRTVPNHDERLQHFKAPLVQHPVQSNRRFSRRFRRTPSRERT